MSISNYAELQTAIANYLHRSDLTSIIPDFISLAESKLNRILRTRFQVTTAAGNVSASVALPADFAELISITVTTGGSTYPITYRKPSEITGDSAGTFFYTIIGDNIVFDPVGTGYTYTLTYYAKVTSLSAGVNWLITKSPDIYVYASLMEAAPYIKDDRQISVWSSMLSESIDSLIRQDLYAECGTNLRMTAG